jgi:hypothetical protein
MTIESKLTKKDYQNLMLLLTYRKPMTIVFVIIGILSFILPVLYLSGFKLPFDKPPYTQMIFGFVIVFALPLMIIYSANKTFVSNLRLHEKIIYEFNQDIISITGESFNSQMDWTKIHKIKELKNWILIYQSNQVANIIKKNAFGDNLDEFRELIKKVR